MVGVLRMVAEPRDMLAAEQAPQAKPGLMRNRDHDRSPRHTGEFSERSAGLLEMLENLQAENEIEFAIGERQRVNALPAQVAVQGRVAPRSPGHAP